MGLGQEMTQFYSLWLLVVICLSMPIQDPGNPPAATLSRTLATSLSLRSLLTTWSSMMYLDPRPLFLLKCLQRRENVSPAMGFICSSRGSISAKVVTKVFGGEAKPPASCITAVAAQTIGRESVISHTLLRASLPDSITKGGETRCSSALSGASRVAQGSVAGGHSCQLRQGKKLR